MLQAESNGIVWCMDRVTFRSIIVVSTMEKRQRYEQSLASMPLFAALSPDHRAVIADCLCLETFQVTCYDNTGSTASPVPSNMYAVGNVSI